MPRKRPYTLKQRAESQEATRQKIVAAAVELHEELGPRATTISAIAERAGVQRLTLYRHFPTEADIFKACSSHWFELHPPPDVALWAGTKMPIERTRIALAAFYAYYSRTRGMWTRVHADALDLAGVQAPLDDYAEYLKTVAHDLAAAFGAGRATPRLELTLQHSLAFATWADLEAGGANNLEKVSLAAAWIDGVLGSRK
jgi:AcrR family transcriptional regulator